MRHGVYATFWTGSGINSAPQLQGVLENAPQENVQSHAASWLERAERPAAACRAWLAFVADLVGLLFQILIPDAVAWGLFGTLALCAADKAALQTKQDARVACRTGSVARDACWW